MKNFARNIRSACSAGQVPLAWPLVLAAILLAAQLVSAQTYKVIYSFHQEDGTVFGPTAGLIKDAAGNFYGVNWRSIFRLDVNGSVTFLHTFADSEGIHPLAALIADRSGNLYGSAYEGGSSTGPCGGLGCGTVFKLAPDGTFTMLYNFGSTTSDGTHPTGALVRDAAGNLYGTTSAGGTLGYGTVFKVDPIGNETVLYNFTGGTDGKYPRGLAGDAAGNLYGTTEDGGDPACDPGYGCGTIFKLDVNGNFTVLHAFAGYPGDGELPEASLVWGPGGKLYGTTRNGGRHGRGTIFRMTVEGELTVLYSFTGAPNGDLPASPLLVDPSGNIYGTTMGGAKKSDNAGTVFKFNVKTRTFTQLHSFYANSDGWVPLAGLIRDKSGALYGTTEREGAYGMGSIFKITP